MSDELYVGKIFKTPEKIANNGYELEPERTYKIFQIYAHHVVCDCITFGYRKSFTMHELVDKEVISKLPDPRRINEGRHNTL